MPVCVSQIYISGSPTLELPDHVWQATQSFLAQIPEPAYHLFGAEEVRAFIESTFGREVVRAFDQLVPYAYKADLARYCLLHELGGWYIDLGLQGNNVVLNTGDLGALFFRNMPIFNTLAWPVANGLMYSQPKNKVFEICVEMIVAHCQERYYGTTPLCPTGPSLLGRAIARIGAVETTLFGDCAYVADDNQGRRTAFTLPNGTTVAHRRRGSPGDVAAMGLAHTNNYAHLYETHQIYEDDGA